MENQNQKVTKSKNVATTLGEIEAQQERFKVLWEKWREGDGSPDEQRELLKMQEEYWAKERPCELCGCPYPFDHDPKCPRAPTAHLDQRLYNLEQMVKVHSDSLIRMADNCATLAGAVANITLVMQGLKPKYNAGDETDQ